MTDIAIVGLDCRYPKAPDPQAFWRLLLAGADAITEVPADRWNADDYHDPQGAPGTVNTRSGGFLDDADAFDHGFFGISPRDADAMDPQQRLLLQTTWRAFEDATLDPRAQAGSRTGVFVGVMANEWANLQMRDYAAITPAHGSGNGYFMTANRLSYQLDLRGPSIAVDTACSSSLVAVHLACGALASGECDQAVAAGVNLVLTPAVGVFYTQAGLSAPDARCKPFSVDADGIVRGEGVAALVLRRLDDAVAQGLAVYAVIKGSAVNSDGRSNGITAPSRWAQQEVVGEAYRRAGVTPDQIDFIEAHGTGTVLGDMIEVRALGHLHGTGRARPCGIGSVKGNLGHTEGAAGLAGLIKAALSLHHGVVPPTRFADRENPKLRLDKHGLRLLAEPMQLAPVAHAGVSSFGIGGTNAHVVLASGPAAHRPGGPGAGVLTVSSNDTEGLRRNVIQLADALAAEPADRFAQLCWTSNTVKASGRHRLAVVAENRDDAVERLRAVSETGVAGALSVGWMFTGQGSQFSGMASRPASVPAYRRALADVDATMAPHLGRSIQALLLNVEAGVDDTELAQPAIFAHQYALAHALADAGVRPAWLLGHSIGEFAAAAVAGVLSLVDACRLVVARGRLMQCLPSGGGMLAVPTQEVAALVAAEPDVAIAAVNGTANVVLSGAESALARIAARLAERGVQATPLAVSHAFHSPLMDPMIDRFAEVAQTCTYRPPTVPIYSTVRGRLLDEPMDAAYWVEHVRATVRFADAAAGALATQTSHVVEIGPRRVLAGLLRRIEPEAVVLGVDPREVVAALYRDGLDPDWDVLYEPAQRVRRRLPGYDFSTRNRFWTRPAAETCSAGATGAPTSTTDARPSASDIATTFRTSREESTMDQLIALFREQTAVLARAAGNPTTPLTAPENAALDATAIVRGVISRISGLPVARLRDTQTIVGDLAFDSLLLTDLFAGLARKVPGVRLDGSWFGADTTIADVVAHVGSKATRQSATAATEYALAAHESSTGAIQSAPAAIGTDAVSPEYRIEDFAEVKAIAARLSGAEALGLTNPYFLVNDGVTRDTSVIDGTPVLNFSSYNYLGMSGHPAVVAAVQDAVARYGSSCSASRVLSGEKPVHRELEAELAALLGVDDAIALVGGHSTNVTIIGHLVGPEDLVVHDSLAHDSIIQGCKLSGATRRPFPHNDHGALDGMLTELRHRYRRVLILIEGVYSQDGDIPDLPAFIAVKRKHKALLMIDEAHSVGVLGATGGGIGEHFGVDRRDVELWSGTMSKALAGCGGYVAGSAELIRFLKYTTPGFVYSVGMTPANAAASLAAMQQLRVDKEPLNRLRHNAKLFLQLAKEAGIDTGDSHDTPVVPCIVGDSVTTLQLSNALLRRGINVNPILYPAVPEDLARLRFFVTACHTDDQIRDTVKVLAEELALVRA